MIIRKVFIIAMSGNTQILQLINRGTVNETEKSAKKTLDGIMKKNKKEYNKWLLINAKPYLKKKVKTKCIAEIDTESVQRKK